MKRLIALFLILILCFLTVACSNNSVKDDDTKKTDRVTTADKNDKDSEKITEPLETRPIESIENPAETHKNPSESTESEKPAIDAEEHKDANSDKKCDTCGISVVTTFDFYAINDLHGKLVTSSSVVGVEGLSTYLKQSAALDDNPIFLSSGDMWQGGAESNLTKGLIVTDWMNEMGFASMTLGNHEFDWGEDYIEENAGLAKFPFLAINIYEKSTNKPVDYCESSILIECNGLQVGIIGAIGDCYSSISAEKSQDIYFKTGSELTALVKAESQRLRDSGADLIVYSLHDGYGQSTSSISDSAMASYYDVSLSENYVDLVFEGHSHKGYTVRDSKNVYHLQNSGDNGGISHAEIEYNFANGDYTVTEAGQVSSSKYRDLTPAPIVPTLVDKYKDIILKAEEVVGQNRYTRNGDAILSTVARLYFEAGNARWGDKYDIVLGGGFMSVRSPYKLYAGTLKYADLQAVLPFDNELVLCSIKGRELSSKFINTTNDNYYIYCGDYGNSIKNNINSNATYYLITDSYSAYYAPNKLTVIEKYDSKTFARDLLADYIKAGNWS